MATTFTQKFLQIAFVSFLLIIIVGFAPFESSDDIREQSSEGTGNSIRQVTFVIFFILAVLSAWLSNQFLKIILDNKLVLILCAFAVLSSVWSVDPSITFRRSVLLLFVVYTFIVFVYSIGFESSFSLIYKLLFSLIVVSVVLSLFFPNARHLSADVYDDSLIGSWRGLFGHKNEASALSCLFIIMALAKFDTQKIAPWLIGLMFATVMLLFSGSKTCLMVLPLSLAFGYIIFKTNTSLAAGMSWLFFLPVIFVLSDYIYNVFFTNPELFSGRGAIWSVLIESIQDSPLFGHGYGILWNSGEITPLSYFGVNTSSWASFVSHGHNGYLDVFASLGLIGYILIILVFFKICTLANNFSKKMKMVFCIFTVFFLLHNFLESSFLMADKFNWIFFLMFAVLGGRDAGEAKV